MKPILKTFFILAFLCPKMLFACWYEDPDASHHTFLDYFLLKKCVNGKYFFYTGYKNHRCQQFTPSYDAYFSADNSEKDLNLSDWQKMTDTKLKTEDIAQIVYQISLDSLQKIANGQIKLQNTFANYLLKKKDYLDYLIFAKKCEPHVAVYQDWEENEQSFDKNTMQSLFEEGENILSQTTDLALKQRYLYQLIRLASFLDSEISEKIFEEYHTDQMPQGFIYARILGRLAMSHKEKNPAKAKFLYAQIFDKFRDSDIYFAEIAYISFRKIEVDKNQWEECLAFAQKPSEKATLWTMLAYQQSYLSSGFLTEYNPKNYPASLVCLQNAYQADPKNELVEILLLQEIQKNESELLAANFMIPQKSDSAAYQISKDVLLTQPVAISEKNIFVRFWEAIVAFFSNLFSSDEPPVLAENLKSDANNYFGIQDYNIFPVGSALSKEQIAQKQAFKEFVEKAAQENKALQPAFWHLMACYFNILDKNFEKAKKFAQSTQQNLGKEQNPDIEKMLRLLENYIKLENTATIDEKFEKEQTQFWKAQKDTVYRFQEFFFNRLAQKYLAQNELAKAALAFRKGSDEAYGVLADMYLTEKEFANYYELVKNPKSDWISYLHPEKTDYLLDLWAVRLARENQLEAAFGKLKEIDATYWKNAFTFRANFGDNFNSQTSSIYTHLSFFQKIDSLNQLAKSDSKKAADYFIQIGNALASTPYWGYSNDTWNGNLISVARSFNGGQYPLNISGEWANKLYVGQEKFLRRYGTGLVASKYYEKAIALDKNSEKASQAAFLALSAMRKQNTHFHEQRHTETDLDYYKQLFKTSYSASVQKFSSQCPELKAFL